MNSTTTSQPADLDIEIQDAPFQISVNDVDSCDTPEKFLQSDKFTQFLRIFEKWLQNTKFQNTDITPETFTDDPAYIRHAQLCFSHLVVAARVNLSTTLNAMIAKTTAQLETMHIELTAAKAAHTKACETANSKLRTKFSDIPSAQKNFQ